MKKLLTILLLFFTIGISAQGIKLSGVTYTDPSTGFHIDSLFAYYTMGYNSKDSIVTVSMPFSNSQSNARASIYIQGAYPIYGIPFINYQFKSIMGEPNRAYLYGQLKPWLMTTYGFTSVTTF